MADSVILSFDCFWIQKWTFVNVIRTFTAVNVIPGSINISNFPFRGINLAASNWFCKCWIAIDTRITKWWAKFASKSTNWTCRKRLRWERLRTTCCAFNSSERLVSQIWADMLRGKRPPEDRPELLLSLNYLPQAERLTIVIMKAKNLDTIQDPYVKVRKP